MGSAAQIINLTAGYLAPEFRRRQVRSLPELLALLDLIFKLLRQASGSAVFAMLDDLNTHLIELRARLPFAEWHAATQRIRQHPIMELILQDPLTCRGLRCPRGYTPDAVLLDLFYREQSAWPLPRGTTPLGNQIYGYVSLGGVAEAMRNRCAMLRAEIDRIATTINAPTILSLGCAHLRELRASAAFRDGQLGRVVALDQDPRAIAQLAREIDRSAVDLRCVKDFESIAFHTAGHFDFIYSPNLLEQLETPRAIHLTAMAFRALNSGGKLWLGSLNFIGDGVAWFEAMMDWAPIYRDSSELKELTTRLPANQVASLRTFPDPDNRIAFIEIVRT